MTSTGEVKLAPIPLSGKATIRPSDHQYQWDKQLLTLRVEVAQVFSQARGSISICIRSKIASLCAS